MRQDSRDMIEKIIISEFDFAEEENDLPGMLEAISALARFYGIDLANKLEL